VLQLTACLNAEQVAEFHREGFLKLPCVAPPEDVQHIGEILDDLFARHRELPKENAYELGSAKDLTGTPLIPQVIAPEKLKQELLETTYFKNARAISEQLLGKDCKFQGGHAIYKTPRNQKATPWHQDQAYWNRGVTTFSANFWMPLDDCPVEMGCMQFVPRSHLGDLRPHHPAGNDPNMHTLETDVVDIKKAVPCPLEAGGCTIHTLKTLHYTGPNNTDKPRRAYILTFGYEWQVGDV
jgi:hypothetical protein